MSLKVTLLLLDLREFFQSSLWKARLSWGGGALIFWWFDLDCCECRIAEDPRGNTLGRGTEITLYVLFSSHNQSLSLSL